jgi:Fis family transcriptional regulator, factor for inversion stimulation protein
MQTLDNQLTTPLAETIQALVTHYLEKVGLNNVTNLRNLLLETIEPPLLEEVITYCRYNQSKAAKLLGISRTTYREKLIDYFADRYCKLRKTNDEKLI